MTQTTQTPEAFSAADIEANRAGRLADDQRRYLRSGARSFSRSMLTGAVLAGAIGVLLATAIGPAKNASERPLAAAAFFVGAVVCLLLALRPNPEAGDASSGRVDAVEGAIGKTSRSSGSGSSTTTHYLEIGEKRYSVPGDLWRAAPETGWLRIYVTPRSHKVVNFERLPDKVVPDIANATPAALLGEFKSAFLSRDRRRATRPEPRWARWPRRCRPRWGSATPPPLPHRRPTAIPDRWPRQSLAPGRWARCR
jgi:hypothetical protein